MPDKGLYAIYARDALYRSRIANEVCVALTSNRKCATTPGNVLLPSDVTGLPKDSVANLSQVVTLDKSDLTESWGAEEPSNKESAWLALRLVVAGDPRQGSPGR